jgi:hypothetical protein
LKKPAMLILSITAIRNLPLRRRIAMSRGVRSARKERYLLAMVFGSQKIHIIAGMMPDWDRLMTSLVY